MKGLSLMWTPLGRGQVIKTLVDKDEFDGSKIYPVDKVDVLDVSKLVIHSS